jgi:hypothetical protein
MAAPAGTATKRPESDVIPIRAIYPTLRCNTLFSASNRTSLSMTPSYQFSTIVMSQMLGLPMTKFSGPSR